MGTLGTLCPPSTTNVLPVMCCESSLASKSTTDDKSGSTLLHFPTGKNLAANLLIQSFSYRALVISDLNNPAAIVFARMLNFPSSRANTCQHKSRNEHLRQSNHRHRSIVSNRPKLWTVDIRWINAVDSNLGQMDHACFRDTVCHSTR